MHLKDWLSTKGFTFDPVLDGKVHRFNPSGKNGDDAGWYIGSETLLPSGRMRTTCTVSDFRSDERFYYPERNGEAWNEDDQAYYQDQQKRNKEKLDKDQEFRWAKAKETAQEIIASSVRVGSHPYFKRKQLDCLGIDFTTWDIYLDPQGRLVIPIYQSEGIVCGAQIIDTEGTKKFIPGTKAVGGFHKLPGSDFGAIALCEGFATAVTVQKASLYDTFTAFNCGNLGNVAHKIRSLYPSSPIIIFADDDRQSSSGNAGRRHAELVCKTIPGTSCLFPVFSGGLGSDTDWNDLMCGWGMDEVKRQILEASVGRTSSETDREKGTGNRPPDDASDKCKDQSSQKSTHDKNQTKGSNHQKSKSDDKPQPKRSKADSERDYREMVVRLGKEILDLRFKLFLDEEATLLYKIQNKTKKELVLCHNEEHLLSRLTTNIEQQLGEIVLSDFVNAVYREWRLRAADKLPERPASFAWSDEDKWCIKKLDFKPCEGPYESWTEFLNRLSSPEDFMAFVWSIFEMKSESRQYIWLYDPAGQGGKSTVIRVLAEVFGNSFMSLNNSSVTDSAKWLTGDIFGKRFVAWADCKNSKFCMSEAVRNLTSGDNVKVEFKGEKSFNAKIYTKLIVGSNHEPAISSGGADVSRLIRIDVEKNTINNNDPGWKDRLRDQLPHFLYECRKWYEKKCPNHGDIQIEAKSDELRQSSTEEIEAKFEAIVQRRIVFQEGAVILADAWMAFCKELGLDNFEIGNLKDYLRRCQGVSIGRHQVAGSRRFEYRGFKIVDAPYNYSGPRYP